MSEITIKYTEVWFIDIKLFIYERLKNYVPIIEKIWTDNVFIKNDGSLKNKNKFISINVIWWRVNSFWIRTNLVQIDTYWESVEEVDNIKEIIIDLFNRSDFKWIKSLLKNDYWNKTPSRKWISRATLDFQFTYKDLKY